MDKEKYTIVWQECGEGSNFAARFYVPDFTGYLPFFLSGEEVDHLENKESVPLEERHLLFGLLYGWKHNGLFGNNVDKAVGGHLLEILRKGYGHKDFEELILNVACNIREANGSSPSRVVLESGLDIVPESSKIKSDLIMDLWELALAHSSFEKRNACLTEIVKLVRKVSFPEVLSRATEVISYYGLCSIVLLGEKEDVNEYLHSVVFPNLSDPLLKDKVKSLLECKAPNISDLKI